MSLYSEHRSNWIECKRCILHETRNKVVLARGKIPCDVLFLGEAPGASEDVIGQPFVGPAGHLLQKDIIEQAFGDSRWTYALTNLVGCIPIGEEGTKTAEPPIEAIKACAPRVTDIVEICNPQLIVRVGKLAEKNYYTNGSKILDMVHPAAIMRMDLSQKGLAIQKARVDLALALEELTPF